MKIIKRTIYQRSLVLLLVSFAVTSVYLALELRKQRSENSDLFYYVCWTKYDLSDMIMQCEFRASVPDENRLRLADVWRGALLDDLSLGLTIYPKHPSLPQLMFLLNRDAKKYSQTLPDWISTYSGALRQDEVFARPQYLLPESSVYIRNNQSERLISKIKTPLPQRNQNTD